MRACVGQRAGTHAGSGARRIQARSQRRLAAKSSPPPAAKHLTRTTLLLPPRLLPCCRLGQSRDHRTTPCKMMLNTSWAVLQAIRSRQTLRCGAELFSGPTSRQAQSYIDLRQETERALGQLKDPGVYTYKDKGDSKLRRLRLKAECSPVACAGCTRVLRASLASHDQEQVIIIKARGHHGTLQAPQGGCCLWTVAEAHVIEKYLNSTDSPSTSGMRAAMKSAGFPLRCSGDQLRNFTARARAAKKCSVPQKGSSNDLWVSCRLLPPRMHFQLVSCGQQQPVTKLMVLPTSVCGSDRVCMMFTCPGMLRRAAAAQGKVVKLAVDGKQKILSNEYIILTLSFLCVQRCFVKDMGGQVWRQKSVSSHTGTQEPFMQALVNAESEANVSCVFNSACQLAEQHCKLGPEKPSMATAQGLCKRN